VWQAETNPARLVIHMVNEALNSGLLKAVVYGMSLTQNDPEWVHWKGNDSPQLPRHLLRAALTAFTLQMVSLFDEGVEEAWAASHPGKTPPAFGAMVNEMADKGLFVDGGAVKDLVTLRNRLAHERETYATWEDWDATYRLVQKELKHLGLVH
jgi:hypothetical protein